MNDLQIVGRLSTEALLSVEVSAGTNITDACTQGIELAKAQNMPIKFSFNGVDVIIEPNSCFDDVLNKWRADLDANHEAYMASAEYKERERLRAEANAVDQAKIDALVVKLPNVVGNLPALVSWISQFASINDNINLSFDKQYIAQLMTDNHHVAGANVNLDPKVYKANPSLYGDYVVGQALDHLRIGMPMHPRLSACADHYFSLIKRIKDANKEQPCAP